MKLAIPIAYNFLSLTGITNTAFYEVMGPIDNIDFLGQGFNQWVFPSCLLLMVLLTVFNIYGRLLNFFGLKQYQFDTDYTEEKLDEGKLLIDQHKAEKLLLSGVTQTDDPNASFGSNYEVEKVSLTERIVIYKSEDNERMQMKKGHEELVINNSTELNETSELMVEREINEEKSMTQKLSAVFFK
mmetsp:Transcript_23177/g.22652  ORF Transcript_23177/g.22652 Transcript_23177/m.22652 type:complete len:185 (+) Transcript_23177:1274-1828(+)